MAPHLTTKDKELRDLATQKPELVDSRSGQATGIRLNRCIGVGGMASVFEASFNRRQGSLELSPSTPPRIAIKFMLPATRSQHESLNLDPDTVFVKEVVALERVMMRQPPTEFVVSFYGSGHTRVAIGQGKPMELPWLAIEYVEAGADGVSLAQRVQRSVDGIDPVRAHRLVRGILEGVRVLHEFGVIHRDLKPENVLIAGPVDDETPKIGDCGIARVDELMLTVQAGTVEYCGPEQTFGTLRDRNPLIGPWTDVHAAAAVVWFLIAGETWCQGQYDDKWRSGQRRSLRTGTKLHHGFRSERGLIEQIDTVLGRGAAPRLPQEALRDPSASAWLSSTSPFTAAMLRGESRFASIEAFAKALLPLLAETEQAWVRRCAKQNVRPTVFRATHVLQAADLGHVSQRAAIREVLNDTVTGTRTKLYERSTDAADPSCVAFRPDGKTLVRFGEKLIYFVDYEPFKVTVPEQHVPLLSATRWLVRGPGGGNALVGSRHVLLVRAGSYIPMALPTRQDGGDVGEIQCALGDGRAFGIVTAATDDSDEEPELWLAESEQGWTGPIALPLRGDAHAISFGPLGYVIVGSRKNKRARATVLASRDGNAMVLDVKEYPRLRVVLCGAEEEAWAAGDDVLLRLDRTGATAESIQLDSPTAHLNLDLVGTPWLVTQHAVYRRGERGWSQYYTRSSQQPKLAAIGFTPSGARVVDEQGNFVEIVPHDITRWGSSS